MRGSILRKIKRCKGLSKSSNSNEAAIALKQMLVLIDKHVMEHEAWRIGFEVGDKVVFLDSNRTNEVLTINYVMTGDHLRYPVAFMGGINACGVTMLRYAKVCEISIGKRQVEVV